MSKAVPKKTLFIQLVLLLVLLGCAAWLFSNLGTFGDAVACIVDGIDTLKSVEGQAGVTAAEAASAVPDSVMDPLKQAVPLIAALAVTPAVLIAVINFIIFWCACKAKAGGSTKCTKCLILITMLFLLLGFGFYLGIGIIGMAVGTDDGQESKSKVTDVCDEFIPELQLALEQTTNQLAVAEAQLSNAPPSQVAAQQAEVDNAQFEVGQATKAVDTMADMCTCVIDIFDTLEAFSSPGLACALTCLLLFFINCCTCCRLGAKKEVAPA